MALIDLDVPFDQLKVSRLQHHLAGHPLMTMERLAELAMRSDPDHVRFHTGERRIGTHMGAILQSDPTRNTLRRTLDRLDRAGAFVQILGVRSDPVYRALIDELLDEALPRLPMSDRKLVNRDAAVFLASPGSVTPFHLDHEQNFLCHIRGEKRLYVWDPRDRSVVSEQALEVFYGKGRLPEGIYQDAMLAKAQAITLAPGDSVYMPMGAPHAVATGRDVTVTASFLMNTRTSFDLVETYRANHLLRRLGMTPTPVGDSWVRDSLKRRSVGAVRRVRDLSRGRITERRLQWY
jgi:hypothetical protein